MAIQQINEEKKIHSLNKQVADIIEELGEELKAPAIAKGMAESIRVANTQELINKIQGMKAKGQIKDINGLREYFRRALQKRIEQALSRGETIDKEQAKELAEDLRKDKEQNEDLFVLVNNGANARLMDREEQQRDLEDRQRSVAERSFRVLEAMEKVRDAVVQGKEMLEVDLSYLKDLEPQELSRQMGFLKKFGLKPMAVARENQERDEPEREITVETITKEDIEQGTVMFAIPFRELQSREWRAQAEHFRQQFKERGIESDKPPIVRIDENVPVLMRGLENGTKTGPVIEEVDEAR